MFLNRISLRHYRNYEHVELQTEHHVNIFVGPNAQGKTNLLEAIYVLALTKSHRTQRDKELIQWQQQAATVSGEVRKKYGSVRLDFMISGQGKRAKINGLEQKKLSEFIGMLNVVLFAPEDLEIVKGSPAIRRRFLDIEIGQVQPAYLHHLMQYQKVLAQRNHYLRNASNTTQHDPLLEVWNEQLATFGVTIIRKRKHFIEKLQHWAENIHLGITDQRERLQIHYHPTFEWNESEDETVLIEKFMIKLTQMKEQELRRGMTLIGPHRDDLAFTINDKDAQTFGSQGQQRTVALSLKLAEIEFIREEVGEYPILLLDDVLSELDQSRQTQLIETFQQKVQTFITATDVNSLNLDKINNAGIYHVVNGTISVD